MEDRPRSFDRLYIGGEWTAGHRGAPYEPA